MGLLISDCFIYEMNPKDLGASDKSISVPFDWPV